MKIALLAAASLAAFAAPALAQSAAGPSREEVKVDQLIIYGDDPCPASSDDTIIVCARRPEGDRFRIPENLRDAGKPQSESWANRAIELSYVGRTGIGSCSTVGPGGMTGCLNQIINQAKAERANSDEINWGKMIEEARQERLSKIDAEAEAIEREQSEPR